MGPPHASSSEMSVLGPKKPTGSETGREAHWLRPFEAEPQAKAAARSWAPCFAGGKNNQETKSRRCSELSEERR